MVILILAIYITVTLGAFATAALAYQGVSDVETPTHTVELHQGRYRSSWLTPEQCLVLSVSAMTVVFMLFPGFFALIIVLGILKN